MIDVTIAVLLIFLVFAALMGFVFLVPLTAVIVNALILYFLSLRVSTDIQKYGQGELYAISGVAAALVLVIFGNFFPLWWITSLALLAYILARLYHRFG